MGATVLGSPLVTEAAAALEITNVPPEVGEATSVLVELLQGLVEGFLRPLESGIEAVGLTNPWPIRTLRFDKPLAHVSGNGGGS